MSVPNISVVMSVYNGARQLRNSIDSILNQEGVGFEFIIVNDGSTDESPSILEEHAKKDSRIRLIHQENQGLTKALIRGCAEAKGEFIARQDAGDISYQNRLRKQLELISSNENLVMCSCWARMLGPGGETLIEIKRPADFKIATYGLLYDKQGPPCHGTVMFRKDVYKKVGGYHHQFYYTQDSDLWLRLGSEGSIGYIQEFLYDFTRDYSDISLLRRPIQKKYAEFGQLCHKARLQGKSEEQLLKEAAALEPMARAKRSEDKERKWKVDYFIGSCLMQRKDSRALGYLWKAACGCPININVWIKIFLCIPSLFVTSKLKMKREPNPDRPISKTL